MTFETKKYQVIKNALPYELANFCLNYLLLKRDAVNFMYDKNIMHESSILGSWKDNQVPNTYSCYSDFMAETLLVKMLPIMKKHTNLNLIPTYSYMRAYKQGDKLRRHKDRPSCEVSTTLNLGGDPWPIFIDSTGSSNVIDEFKEIHKPDAPKGEKVLLEVGDMLVYSGCELEHWREPFDGDICGQVFLHYNHVNGPFADKNKFDGRPMLGLPTFVK
tara:strand:- start:283 stop:933 length:651 start_codon:yes stop_codon:yes gene_type:complete